MVTRWLTNSFQRLTRIFSSSEETNPNESSPTSQQQPEASHSAQTHDHKDPSSGNTGKQGATSSDARLNQGSPSNDARNGDSQSSATADTKRESSRDGRDEEVNSELFDNEFRRDAEKNGRLRKECFEKADKAREDNDHAAANEHVKEAKKYTLLMEEANAKAVEYIMRINKNNTADTIDLHGLRVEEALEEVKKKLSTVTGGVLHVIPGRGSHSENQKAKIKPKIMEYLKSNNYRFEEDNPGSFTVFLS